jgi:2-dehydropantoate 2-reductase
MSESLRPAAPAMQPILVWGAGAIGGTVGATLKRAGHDVSFVDRVAEHVAAIADPAHGLRITGPVASFTVTAPAWTPADVRGLWRHIFLAVKAQDTEAACRALLPHLSQDGYVLSLQNGLNERVIARIAGRDRTIGAFVNFGADWVAPGEILFANRGAVVLGEVTGAMTPRLAELHAAMRDFDSDAIATGDIWGYLWGKLGYGALLFAQALGDLGIADCLARPELLPLWRALAGEAVAVALAEGVSPRGFNGYDPAAFAPGASEEAARASVAAMVAFNRPNAKTHSGVWRDLAIRKRRTEVDAQIAPIAEIGAGHGLACPATHKLVAMIHEIEQGSRPLSDGNLLELLAVC